MSVRKQLLGLILAAATIAILAVVAIFAASEFVMLRKYPVGAETVNVPAEFDPTEARRWAKLWGCSSCHGVDLKGHMFNDNAYYAFNFAPNLVRLAENYSDEEFAQAIRQGVRPTNGRALWGMPSQILRHLNDDEIGLMIAYIRSMGPSDAQTPADSPGLLSRMALTWNALFPSDPRLRSAIRPAPELIGWTERRPAPDIPGFGRGRHIVISICAECHGSDLKGDASEGAPDLIVAASYDRASFRRLLRTGSPIGGRDLGEMSEVAAADFKVFTDDEIDAVHDYLIARAGSSPTGRN